MKNKASIGVWIGVILGIIFIGVIITVLIIAYQKGWFEKQQPEEQTYIKFFMRAEDENTKEFIDVNYVLDYNQNPPIIISKGKLSKEQWTEIEVPIELVHLHCWSEEYYYGRTNHIFSTQEIITNISKSMCHLRKIGNISITHTGDLNRQNNLINLQITSEGFISKPAMCIEWSPGIIYAIKSNNLITCDKGNWLNYSFYNETSKQYTLLDEDYYRCGNCQGIYCDWAEQCEYVKDNQCRIKEMEIPFRFKGKADSCVKLSSDINNKTINVEITVKTMENLNQLDYVRFYIFDRDKVFDSTQNLWVLRSEWDEVNLGLPYDIEYQVNYIK